MIRVIAVASIAVLLTGCKPIKEAISETFYRGTLAGMGTCLDGMRIDLVSLETAKAVCASQYAEPLPISALYALNGNGGPEVSRSDKLMTGILRNQTVNYVVTEVKLSVVVYENDGKTNRSHEVTVVGWFEPKDAAQDFRSLPIEDAPDDWSEKTLPDCPTPRTGRCWEWSIEDAKGLRM